MNEKLQRLYEALDSWCALHRMPFDNACDEDNLQGYLIFNQDTYRIPRLLQHLRPLVAAEGLHVRAVETRAGVVLAFSLQALTEEEVDLLYGSELARALDGVLGAPLAEVSQYNWSSHARARNRERFNYERFGGDSSDPPSGGDATRRVQPGKEPKDFVGIDKDTGRRVLPTRRGRFRAVMPWLKELAPGVPAGHGHKGGSVLPGIMGEDMQGIAAHVQPSQMLKGMDQAMRDAGLHAALDAANIKNKLSDDRQRIIFYTTNAQGAQQPIIAFDLVQLGEGSKMKEALRSLMDLAQQHAPGEGELQLKRLQDKDRAIGQIADKYVAKDHEPGSASQQMAQQMPAVESFSRRVAVAFDK